MKGRRRHLVSQVPLWGNSLPGRLRRRRVGDRQNRDRWAKSRYWSWDGLLPQVKHRYAIARGPEVCQCQREQNDT
jgi:hypothetical protein